MDNDVKSISRMIDNKDIIRDKWNSRNRMIDRDCMDRTDKITGITYKKLTEIQ